MWKYVVYSSLGMKVKYILYMFSTYVRSYKHTIIL